MNDVGSMIDNKAIERIISLMTVQLCLLILSMEKKGMENEVFASFEKTAEELVQVSEEFCASCPKVIISKIPLFSSVC